MKYPYIGEYRNPELTVLFTGNGIGCEISSNEYHSDWSQLKYKNITREYLSNTWGIVKSKEHAEFIIELAELHGFGVWKSHKIDCGESIGTFFFCPVDNELQLYHNDISSIMIKGEKQITIPLPPKAKTKKPDSSKLPIHFDCVCNKCGGKCCIGNCDEWSKVGGDKVMNNIKWKDGAVCFAGGKQYTNVFIPSAVMAKDFQLNEIRTGDYIEASELDNEQKYNDIVEVFGLFGFTFDPSKSEYPTDFNAIIKGSVCVHLYVSEIGFLRSGNLFGSGRKLTYPQLMTIGKLKRAMIDFEKFNHSDIQQNEKRNKAKQAYKILKSLDYEYDLDKQKWFKKEYI